MILIFTGDGKGKTTAALGQGFRAVGDGKKVLMIQFIKGPWKSGEEEAAKKFGDDFKIVKGGLGFVGILGDTRPIKEHQAAAQKTWELAKGEILSGKWDLVILDEINNALHLNLLNIEEVVEFIGVNLRDNQRESAPDIILTGRDANVELMELADLVTEMREIKHPYEKGEEAKKGIEY